MVAKGIFSFDSNMAYLFSTIPGTIKEAISPKEFARKLKDVFFEKNYPLSHQLPRNCIQIDCKTFDFQDFFGPKAVYLFVPCLGGGGIYLLSAKDVEMFFHTRSEKDDCMLYFASETMDRCIVSTDDHIHGNNFFTWIAFSEISTNQLLEK